MATSVSADHPHLTTGPSLMVVLVFEEGVQKAGDLRFLLQDSLLMFGCAVAIRELGQVGGQVFYRHVLRNIAPIRRREGFPTRCRSSQLPPNFFVTSLHLSCAAADRGFRVNRQSRPSMVVLDIHSLYPELLDDHNQLLPLQWILAAQHSSHRVVEFGYPLCHFLARRRSAPAGENHALRNHGRGLLLIPRYLRHTGSRRAINPGAGFIGRRRGAVRIRFSTCVSFFILRTSDSGCVAIRIPRCACGGRRAHHCCGSYYEAIKPRSSPRSPVRPFVILGLPSRSHHAIKTMLQRINHYSHVPRPRHQIARVRGFHALEILVPCINLKRTRVRILKPGVGVNLMNEMRAVAHSRFRRVLLPGYIHDRTPFLWSQQSLAGFGLVHIRSYLRPCRRSGQQAHADCPQERQRQSAQVVPGHSPLESLLCYSHRHGPSTDLEKELPSSKGNI